MTPKEKAEELFQLFLPFVQSSEYIEEIKYKCKQCSLISVDEIIKQNVSNPTDYGASWTYWMQVKTEIEKL